MAETAPADDDVVAQSLAHVDTVIARVGRMHGMRIIAISNTKKREYAAA